MPMYMLQFGYTTEAWGALMRRPEDRTAVLEKLATSAGGRIHALYYHMGDFDGTVILEAPDDTTANAVITAAIASGSLRNSRTTRLYTPKEMLEVLQRASKVEYRPPGTS